MILRIAINALVALTFTTLAGAAELVLDKLPLEFNISLGDSACNRLLHIPRGKDIFNLAGTPCYLASGRYTFTLDGPAGTQVTLFAEPSFGKERGFLTVVKEDDILVWILHLEDFPTNQWVARPRARKYGSYYGGYRAFYHPGTAFRERVTSIRWGQWWTGDTPGGP